MHDEKMFFNWYTSKYGKPVIIIVNILFVINRNQLFL